MNTPVVDTYARKRAAQVLRDFISGKITNDQFSDTFPISKDAAMGQIFNAVWPYYDDMHEHRLTGTNSLHPVEKREMLRWIVFLDSDLPYVWPERANPQFAQTPSRLGWMQRLFKRREDSSFQDAGDVSQWPFAHRADIKHALRNPKRLNGAAA